MWSGSKRAQSTVCDGRSLEGALNTIDGYGSRERDVTVPSRHSFCGRQEATNAQAVKSSVDETAKTFGRLDVLVNNAGTAIPKPFEETTLEEMDRLIDINMRGKFVATQAALRHMKSGGRIITIGSSVCGAQHDTRTYAIL